MSNISSYLTPCRKLASTNFNQAMVVPRAVTAELFKKREDAKARSKGLLNNASIQILGSNVPGFSPSLLVHSEGHAYLFNCGEGQQRNCYSNKIKLTNLENVFLTHSNWSKIAGAYGLSLTLQDIGISRLTINSTEALGKFFTSAKSFLNFHGGIEGRTRNIIERKYYEDSNIHIRCIPIDSSICLAAPKRRKEATDLAAYLCSLPDLPGALDPQRCRELNVPIGPKLGALKSGQDIELDDGTIIRSADVCGPKNQGAKFIVIDCPSVNYIESVITNPDLYVLRNSFDEKIDLVAHLSPPDVSSDPRYKKWMSEFPKDCKHILTCSSKPKLPNFIDSYRLHYLLRQLDSEMFPELFMPCQIANKSEQSIEANNFSKGDEAELKTVFAGYLKDQSNIIEGSTFDKFSLRPNQIYEVVEKNISLDLSYIQAKYEVDFDEEYARYKTASMNLPDPVIHEPEVVFLGTGSALPSKLRNTSCILVNFSVPHRASIMLDCGEGSYGQLVRFYGPDRSREFLKNLEMIYISHHHADHHIGLIEILRHRSAVAHDAIKLLIPPGIETHLNYYNESFEDLSKTYEIMSTQRLHRSISDVEQCKSKLIRDLVIVPVDHCHGSCAAVFEFNIGRPGMKTFKLSYSGDARPSDIFAQKGLDCDLLIHEATFDHRDKESALEKKHSTTEEAIGVARKMKAKFTILTHFSQRYPKIPYPSDDFDETIGFAFDNMALKCPSHFPRIPLMKNLLKVVFAKSLGEIDERYRKKERKEKCKGSAAEAARISPHKNQSR